MSSTEDTLKRMRHEAMYGPAAKDNTAATPHCSTCNTTENLIKGGTMNGKQLYRCTTCSKKKKPNFNCLIEYKLTPQYQEWERKSKESMARILAHHG